jgi:hypothetical protein
MTWKRITLKSSFCIGPKAAYVRLELDGRPLLEMTSNEARTWATEIIREADAIDGALEKYAAEHEAEQVLRKAEGYDDGHFNRIPDSAGLPRADHWDSTDAGDGNVTIWHITSRIKDDILDLYKAAGYRPDKIVWHEEGTLTNEVSEGTLILYGVTGSTDWFAEWASSGRRGIEGYLAWIGDPRFPYVDTLSDMCSDIYLDFEASDEEIACVILESYPDLDDDWVRRMIPRLREKEVAV